MAHVVGVPRRDPCQKCKLPVFLAERLTVGKKVYHRTCLKCARCGYQLTPGSFYETEVDDEFCCETCPDEEELGADSATAVSSVQLRHEPESTESPVVSPPRSRSVRSSIADRLAFFEQSKASAAAGGGVGAGEASSAKLLQKSLSDEEKTKSLQKIEASTAAPYKMNSALSSFLNDTIDAGGREEAEDTTTTTSEATSSAAETQSVSLRSQTNLSNQMETSDSEDDDELSLENRAPELPKSLPPRDPSDAPMEQPTVGHDEGQREQQKKFTATAQLQLTSKWTADVADLPQKEPLDEPSAGSGGDAERNVEQKQTKKTEVQLNLIVEPTTTTETASTLIAATDDNVNNNKNNNYNNDGENNKAQEAIPTTTTMQDAEMKDMNDDNNDDDDEDTNDVKAKLEPRKPNDNNCVTKEETPENDAQQTTDRIEAPSVEAVGDAKETTTITMEVETEQQEQHSPEIDVEANTTVELRPKTNSNEDPEASVVSQDRHLHPEEDVETTKRLSVVRARLHQFEVIANNVPDLDKDNANDNNRIGEHNDSPSRSPNHKPDAEAESPLKVVDDDDADHQKPKAIEEITDNVKETDKSLNQVPTEEVVTDEHHEEVVEGDGEKVVEGDGEKVVEVVEEEVKKDNEHVDIKSVEMPMELEEEERAEKGEREDKTEPIKMEESEETAPKLLVEKPKVTSATTPGKSQVNEYPEDLNPFQSDNDDDQEVDANKENILRSHLSPAPRSLNVSHALSSTPKTAEKPSKQSLNPFDSSDDEVELEKSGLSSATSTPSTKVPPPRPPPPRISRNPFGEENDDMDNNFSRRSSLSSSLTRKTPVPTPRSNVSQSQNPTPEPTPRLSNKTQQQQQQSFHVTSPALQNTSGDYYGSANSLSTPNHSGLYRNSDVRGSNNSLTSSAGGTIRSRKQRRAPAPPQPPVKELFPNPPAEPTSLTNTAEGSSKASTPSSSTVGTPRQGRKKRPAPAPPKPARLDPALLPTIAVHDSSTIINNTTTTTTQPKNLLSYPLQAADLDSKLSDEEKALLEGNLLLRQPQHNKQEAEDDDLSSASRRSSRRMIPLDASLLEDEGGKCDDIKHREQEEEMNVVYRRILVPPSLETPTHESNPLLDHLNGDDHSHDRQLEKLKDNKEAKNRNRQSQISASSGAEDSDPTLYNKSAHGKWKRRKGPAPALPIPPRKVLQMLPLQEIKHELEIIEVQQQGLEKQGVVLEKMIRDRCEGENGEPLNTSGDDVTDGKSGGHGENSKEVEDLILQLFELVNEKNELFRRQAELMYLRRQHRLEQEQADLEYEIRVLMAQPERNKTDSDKAREEALIARLVDVVQLRNEVIECLEMDRLREAEEDMSIKKRLELHTAQREGDDGNKTPSAKLSKKEKKKQKETKKLGKSKKLDADKDADESELNSDKQKAKKKKKKFIF